MNTNAVFLALTEHLKTLKYEDFIIELANNPFVTIIFIGDERANSYSFYFTPQHKAFSSQYNTTTNTALSYILATDYLKSYDGNTKPTISEHGYCNSVILDGIIIIISIIASPNDASFIYQTVSKQLSIILQSERQ